MFINRLQVNKTRHLDSVSIDELATLNFFVGDNGAGKTSLLEAIAIASLGRSFRSNKVHTVISRDESALSVFLQCTDHLAIPYKLGIQRDRKNNFLVRINGSTATSLAQLSTILPVVVLDANAFDLLDGASSLRRKLIEWGVFHVEHRFHETWKRINRILKQRNSLLRKGIDDYALYHAWDVEFVTLAIELDHFRVNYLHQFQQALNEVLAELDPELSQNRVFYKNGWGQDRYELSEKAISEQVENPQLNAEHLLDQLKLQFTRDLKYQRTHVGPHKADMQIKVSRHEIKDIYSRGQKKTLVAAMKLAQAHVVYALSEKRPILLLDDLPSELDKKHLTAFIKFVIREDYQCFITSVDDVIYHDNKHAKARMFHVERGKISPVNGDKAEGEP